jgi:hypothetical protein
MCPYFEENGNGKNIVQDAALDVAISKFGERKFYTKLTNYFKPLFLFWNYQLSVILSRFHDFKKLRCFELPPPFHLNLCCQ